MSRKRGKSKTYEYLVRAEYHFDSLYEDGKMKEPTRASFFRDFLGCSPMTWINWYNSGTKKIYYCILDLLDELDEHKEKVIRLEKELKEFTEK